MRFSVHVEVRGLPGIADPEGRTIERALPALGFSGVAAVRVGKVIAFELDALDEESAKGEVEQMCARLLSNPIIQRAEISVTATGAA
jgi:phosphoribosylformylglycinamidine synthase PurS subunit